MRISYNPRADKPKGFFARVLAIIGTLVLIVLGVMFSVVALAVVAVGGLALWGWFWWKTRAARRDLRRQPPAPESPSAASGNGNVIDGEAVRVSEDQKRLGG